MHKFFQSAGFALVAALVTLGLVSVLDTAHMREARAQNTANNVLVASGTLSIAAATPAVIITNTTSGSSAQSIVLVGIKCATITTGGIVTFYNGTANPTTTGLAFLGTQNFNLYCPVSTTSNNNIDVLPNTGMLPFTGQGAIATTAGNSLCAQLNGATLSYVCQYYYK